MRAHVPSFAHVSHPSLRGPGRMRWQLLAACARGEDAALKELPVVRSGDPVDLRGSAAGSYLCFVFTTARLHVLVSVRRVDDVGRTVTCMLEQRFGLFSPMWILSAWRQQALVQSVGACCQCCPNSLL